jgi:hypothetical protein
MIANAGQFQRLIVAEQTRGSRQREHEQIHCQQDRVARSKESVGVHPM